jgi:hypothetical protein
MDIMGGTAARLGLLNQRDATSRLDIIKISGFIVALLGFLLGGGFFYNEIWKSKVLTYTVLPKYDLGDQVFSGLVIENRGRVPLTDLEIILSNLDSKIDKLNIPGPHETLTVASGGEGTNELFVQMPRLSSGVSVAIYLLTSDNINLQEGKTFRVTSEETVGEPISETTTGAPISIFVASFILWIISMVLTTIVLATHRQSGGSQENVRSTNGRSEKSRRPAKAAVKK